jgi:hypothetical protein
MHPSELQRRRALDRTALEQLLTVLNGAMNALRLDGCGDPAIIGSRGHIHAVDGTFYVHIQCRSALHWTWAKKQLVSVTTVSQDGDEEGILVLTRMPTGDEAATIRHYIGVRQTQIREVSAETMQRLRDARGLGR